MINKSCPGEIKGRIILMSIIRVEHNKDFVIINKTGLNDQRISFKAKGILAYLLSKPDNWYCNRKHLAKIGPDGITAVRSGLKELRKYGYLEKRPIRNQKGRIIEWESIIRETPKPSTQQEDDQKVENPPSGNPTRRDSSRHNKYLNIISNYKTEEEEIPEKIKNKFQQIFNRELSIEFYQKMTTYYSDIKIIKKVLALAESNAKVPKYVLDTLQDWSIKGLTSIAAINTYLKNRQAKNQYKRAKNEITATYSLEELYKEGYQ